MGIDSANSRSPSGSPTTHEVLLLPGLSSMACGGADACGAVSVAMERTALDLMEYFKARAAYTFSDEITLALLPTLTNPPPFRGKIAKLISIASGTNAARARARTRGTLMACLPRYCRLCVSSIQPPHQLARVSPARGGMRSLLLARKQAPPSPPPGLNVFACAGRRQSAPRDRSL
jgi:hypothetical protein